MDAAIIGLVGAFVGAAAALIGSVLTTRLQHRHEQARWQRDRRQAAYDGALRHLLKAANRRGELVVQAGRVVAVIAVIADDQVREVFDDLTEAQFWLRSLASTCGPGQAARVSQAADQLDAAVHSMTHASGQQTSPDLLGAIRIVGECAREDVGGLPAQNASRG